LGEVDATVILAPTSGVSNSKGLAGRMRLKARSRGPQENKIFELCVKNQFIWKNKQNNSLCPFKSTFFLMFAARVFETPALREG
jgi:hypothetical protein